MIVLMLIVCVGVPLCFTVMALLARRLIGCVCKCGRRAKRFDELSDHDKKEVLDYYRKAERREPDTKGIFICQTCETVYDDFSGEKKSLDCDNVSICKVCGYAFSQLPVTYLGVYVSLPGYSKVYRDFVEHNRQFVETIECLRCERHPHGTSDCILCDTHPKIQGCPECFTLYTWAKIGGRKYKYLVPLTKGQLLKQALDPTLGTL